MDLLFFLCSLLMPGVIFFSYLTDFFFLLNCFSESCRTRSEQVKNEPVESRWFQLFFIDFQLFYFLGRVIPVIHFVYLLCKQNRRNIELVIICASCHQEFMNCLHLLREKLITIIKIGLS